MIGIGIFLVGVVLMFVWRAGTAGSGRSGPGSPATGSTSTEDLPMSIVLGYDESPGSRPALAMAVSLAARFDEPLVLVYGAEPPGHGRGVPRAPAGAGRARPDGGRARGRPRPTAAGVRTVVEVLDAKPAQALVDAADRHDARVIVVGTSGESPLRGAILGSVPHKLLQISDRPVLCVPADKASE